MIVWIEKGVDGRPNRQRAKLMSNPKLGLYRVRFLGDDAVVEVSFSDIVGFEYKQDCILFAEPAIRVTR